MTGHSLLMPDHRTPEELAQTKKAERAERVSLIRRRVIGVAATLAAVFSGVVLTRSLVEKPAGADATETAMVTTPDESSQESGQLDITERVVNLASGVAIEAVFGDGESDDDDDDESPSLETSQS